MPQYDLRFEKSTCVQLELGADLGECALTESPPLCLTLPNE